LLNLLQILLACMVLCNKSWVSSLAFCLLNVFCWVALRLPLADRLSAAVFRSCNFFIVLEESTSLCLASLVVSDIMSTGRSMPVYKACRLASSLHICLVLCAITIAEQCWLTTTLLKAKILLR